MKNYLVSAIAALAGLLFGYDVGVISGALLYIDPIFHLSSTESGLIVSGVPFGALVGALVCGKINDYIGRKYAIVVTAVLFALGSLVCASAVSVQNLIIGRLILGLAVGLGSFSAPLYIAELAKKEIRGGLVTFNQLAITLGILLSYSMNYFFSFNGSWRWMMGFGAIPALILLLLSIFLPRSPRWLMTKGKSVQALKTLKMMHGEAYAENEMQEIEKTLSSHSMKLSEILKNIGFKRILLLGIMVSILTQAVGINAIIYYAPTVLKLTGFSSNAASLLATIGIGIINVVFTLAAIPLVDKIGRRKLLLFGLSGITLCLLIIAGAIHYQGNSTSLAIVITLCMMAFVAFQAISTGPACWLIPSEIFPIKVRGIGMGLSVAFNWGTNVVIAFIFPIMLHHMDRSFSFGIFFIIALGSIIYFYYFLPETKGVSLENIEKHALSGIPLRKLGDK